MNDWINEWAIVALVTVGAMVSSCGAQPASDPPCLIAIGTELHCCSGDPTPTTCAMVDTCDPCPETDRDGQGCWVGDALVRCRVDCNPNRCP